MSGRDNVDAPRRKHAASSVIVELSATMTFEKTAGDIGYRRVQTADITSESPQMKNIAKLPARRNSMEFVCSATGKVNRGMLI